MDKEISDLLEFTAFGNVENVVADFLAYIGTPMGLPIGSPDQVVLTPLRNRKLTTFSLCLIDTHLKKFWPNSRYLPAQLVRWRRTWVCYASGHQAATYSFWHKSSFRGKHYNGLSNTYKFLF